MLRVEIISNQSVEDDLLEIIEQEIPEIEYTILPVVHGRGKSSRKLGDSVWPEQNFLLFTYVDEETAGRLKKVVEAVRSKFPREGISVYASQGYQL